MSLRRILVANRGEIALRIVCAARSLGIETTLAASVADRDSMAAREANRVVVIGTAGCPRFLPEPGDCSYTPRQRPGATAYIPATAFFRNGNRSPLYAMKQASSLSGRLRRPSKRWVTSCRPGGSPKRPAFR
jgi:Biotin carboxylase, N-terminal domain